MTYLFYLISISINVYSWIIIVQSLLTWVNPNPNNPFVFILKRVTHPAYKLLAKTKIKTSFNGIDISPLIIIFILIFLQNFFWKLSFQ